MRALLYILTCLALPVLAAGPGEWTWTDIEGAEQAPFEDKDTQLLVIVFISPDCPVANYFHPTLRRMLQTNLSQGVSFVFIHPDPDVTVAAARQHAKDFEIAGPVVIDAKLETAKRLKAEITPEAFVINRAGAVVYRGRINDMFIRPGRKRIAPRTHDLREAITAALAGKPIASARTTAIGCYIFYEDTP